MKKISEEKIKKFQQTIWNYYAKNKRQMPWRETTDPYRIMVSEIMLQQTQVSRVIPKYESFIQKFPDFKTLADASVSEILKLWQGLGYNRRALNLQKSAKIICEKYDGKFPETLEEVDALPGIGEATAGAILAYAFNQSTIFIETNIRRVFLYFFFNDADCKMIDDKDIFPFVDHSLDLKKSREWYYALMDYGAMLKTTVPNPNRRSKHYTKQSTFHGSNREVRGKILKLLNDVGHVSEKNLMKKISDERCGVNIEALIKEGFLKRKGASILIQ